MDGGVRRLDAELQRVDARLGEELLPVRAGRAVATEGVDMPSTGLRRGASRSLLLPRVVGRVALQVSFGCNCHCTTFLVVGCRDRFAFAFELNAHSIKFSCHHKWLTIVVVFS